MIASMPEKQLPADKRRLRLSTRSSAFIGGQVVFRNLLVENRTSGTNPRRRFPSVSTLPEEN
jgi:hypothetical protein